ncbi:hypothetical protein SAMN04487904_11498 [Actinopolyspora lacussalsi subsp. righensis]|uniref:Uncharacterized protein n=2 Tax=Actinopolyspora righensis TaxID=995060 RepID=A0A1I7C4U5_9ACTN|nr:hypothetical protein SAMN04487904_11498 [Actinopolyspora righensis]
MLFVLAVTCGVAVGNIYFPQALVPLIATGLRTSSDGATLAVSATQIGYAGGIFLLVPLGTAFRTGGFCSLCSVSRGSACYSLDAPETCRCWSLAVCW